MSRHISGILENVLREIAQATKDGGSGIATAMYDFPASHAPLSQPIAGNAGKHE